MLMQKRAFGFLAVLLGMMLFWPGSGLAQDAEQQVRAFRVGGVPQAQEVVGLGTVRCQKSLDLGFPNSGVLSKILVEEGDQVKKGQVLAQLDDAVTRAEVASKEAEVDLARQKVDYLQDKKDGKEKLWQRKAISEQEYKESVHLYNQAKISLRQAQAQLKGLKASLAKMALRAPIAGTVARRLGEPGEVVTVEKEPLLRLVACSQVLAEVSFGEKLYLGIRPDMPVLLSADALPGREFIGKVYAISPEVNDKDRTFKVKILTPNPDLILRPGMFVRAGLLRGGPNEPVWIPEAAILGQQDDIGSVKIIKGKKAVLTRVKLGARRNGMIQIKQGVRVGDMVMVPEGANPAGQ